MLKIVWEGFLEGEAARRVALALATENDPAKGNADDWIHGSQSALALHIGYQNPKRSKLMETLVGEGRVSKFERFGQKTRFIMSDPAEHERVKAAFAAKPKRKPRSKP